jgi:hypothetical protein
MHYAENVNHFRIVAVKNQMSVERTPNRQRTYPLQVKVAEMSNASEIGLLCDFLEGRINGE